MVIRRPWLIWLSLGVVLLSAGRCNGPVQPPPPPPVISVSPEAVAFGEVEIGDAAEVPLTVTNVGEGTLEGAASVGAPFAVVSGATYELAEGASQVVVVSFEPAAVGPSEDTVAFTGGGGASVPVSGAGAEPPPLVAAIVPSSSTCGADTAVGASCAVTVESVGNVGSFGGVGFVIANDGFGYASGSVGALTEGCLFAAGASIGIACASELSGSGPVAVLEYVRESADASAFVTSEAALFDFDTGAATPVEGGSLPIEGTGP